MPESVSTGSGAAGAAPARAKKAGAHSRRSKTPDLQVAAAEPAAEASVSEPAYDEIAALAYSYWEARGYQSGSPEEDWLRAERALRGRSA